MHALIFLIQIVRPCSISSLALLSELWQQKKRRGEEAVSAGALVENKTKSHCCLFRRQKNEKINNWTEKKYWLIANSVPEPWIRRQNCYLRPRMCSGLVVSVAASRLPVPRSNFGSRPPFRAAWGAADRTVINYGTTTNKQTQGLSWWAVCERDQNISASPAPQ